MKLLLVARKTLLEVTREFQLIALMLGLPAFFMLITYAAYAPTPKLVTYTVLTAGSDPRAEEMLQTITAQRYPDGRPAFQVRRLAAQEDADELLKRQEGALLLAFSSSAGGELSLEVRGDATSMAYIIASTRLSTILGAQIDALVGKPSWVEFRQTPLELHSPPTDFENYAPGMIVFAVLLLVPQAAMLLGREARSGTLRRLRLSRLARWELLGGITLAQLTIASISVAIMLGMALLLGFRSQGSLLLALSLSLALALAAIGQGLWVASFSADDSQALNLGSVVTMLQVFLSGAFFALPSEPWLTIGGHAIGLFDLIPATHAMTTLKQVLVSGAGIEEVSFRASLLLALSILYLLLGIWMFRRQME